MAAAAVLALFVIARGFGPGSTRVDMEPQRIHASVAITVPEVPEPENAGGTMTAALAGAEDVRAIPRARRQIVRSTAVAADPAEGFLVRVDSPATSFDRQIRRLQESVFQESLGRAFAQSGLVSDGWVQPVRLGNSWSRPGFQAASLVRPVSAVSPAPWNVDRAVSLP
jgi:hypothetical protein